MSSNRVVEILVEAGERQTRRVQLDAGSKAGPEVAELVSVSTSSYVFAAARIQAGVLRHLEARTWGGREFKTAFAATQLEAVEGGEKARQE